VKCGNKVRPFPDEKLELKSKLKTLCEKTGFNGEEIGLMQARSGDMNANAYTNNNSI